MYTSINPLLNLEYKTAVGHMIVIKLFTNVKQWCVGKSHSFLNKLQQYNWHIILYLYRNITLGNAINVRFTGKSTDDLRIQSVRSLQWPSRL